MFFKTMKSTEMPSASDVIKDRTDSAVFSDIHYVLGTRICAPVPDHLDEAVLALGCFGGARDCSGKLKVSTAQPSVTLVALRLIRPTMTYAPE
jgi:hypothetical protein